mmetsp:Transcript_61868/g.160686  ORF Transcript_61868/g.160686 Transcript_61868/m.160686 type:complete len:306 (-) Transcript_61868:72-989(-)
MPLLPVSCTVSEPVEVLWPHTSRCYHYRRFRCDCCCRHRVLGRPHVPDRQREGGPLLGVFGCLRDLALLRVPGSDAVRRAPGGAKVWAACSRRQPQFLQAGGRRDGLKSEPAARACPGERGGGRVPAAELGGLRRPRHRRIAEGLFADPLSAPGHRSQRGALRGAHRIPGQQRVLRPRLAEVQRALVLQVERPGGPGELNRAGGAAPRRRAAPRVRAPQGGGRRVAHRLPSGRPSRAVPLGPRPGVAAGPVRRRRRGGAQAVEAPGRRRGPRARAHALRGRARTPRPAPPRGAGLNAGQPGSRLA